MFEIVNNCRCCTSECNIPTSDANEPSNPHNNQMMCCFVEIRACRFIGLAETRASSPPPPLKEGVGGGGLISAWRPLGCRKIVESQWKWVWSSAWCFLPFESKGSGPNKGLCGVVRRRQTNPTPPFSAVWRNVSNLHGYWSEKSPRCGCEGFSVC